MSPTRSKHGGTAEADLHELQSHRAVVDVAELDPAELDHVDLHPVDREVVGQRLDELLRFVVKDEGTVKKIHADDAEGFLLEDRIRDRAAWRGAGPGWPHRADAPEISRRASRGTRSFP
jgi:hypothetical protein